MLYNSCILPHITYCIEIWGNTFNSFIDPILKLQKKFVRLVTFSHPRASSSPLFLKLGILDVHKLCKLHTCIFTYDLKNDHYAHSLDHYAPSVSHSYFTRSLTHDKLVIPKINLSSSKNSLTFSLVKQWNEIPVSIKSLKSRNLFKYALKSHLLHE